MTKHKPTTSGQIARIIAIGFIGFGWYTLTYPDRWARGEGPFFATWPLWLRTTLWFATGWLTFVLSFFPRHKGITFAIASFMPAERAIGYTLSAIVWVFPGGPPGHVAAIGIAVFWWAIFLMIMKSAECYPDTDMLGHVNPERDR